MTEGDRGRAGGRGQKVEGRGQRTEDRRGKIYDMKFQPIAIDERSLFQARIMALEQTARYPLGNDFFQLDHGRDYFAFFDRLGELQYYAAIDSDLVCAVGAGILRQLPYRQTEAARDAWYLCDLKVHPRYRRRNLPLKVFRCGFYSNVHRCDRGYAISMNPGDGSANRVVRLLERFTPARLSRTVALNLYSLDASDMADLEPLLIEYRGAISYLSLQGVKDLRLQSTGQILPLLHVQWGSTAQPGQTAPQPGYVHMFCSPQDDELAIAIAARNIHPSATATVISHGMDNSDWRFILTSDI